MSYVEDRSIPYKCSVPVEQSKAKLHFGWKRVAVEVIAVSRDEFTLVVPKSVFRKIKQGLRYRICRQDECWEVSCESKTKDSDNRCHLVMRREIDMTPQVAPSYGWWSPFLSNAQKSSADPTLSVGIIVGLILVILIAPGWGESLGTTSFLTDLVKWFTGSIYSTFFG